MILDTNVISEFVAPTPSKMVVDWFSSVPEGGLYVPAIVKAEILLGIELLPAGRRKSILETFVKGFLLPYEQGRILPFEDADAPHYARIVSARRLKGRPLAGIDAQIAAIALRRGLPIATRNIRDFADCGVTLINPWDPAP
ncbi:type II toxin-antitoxin system VapC family toxin [Hoeflea ulvae]|uniref:Ribonuclease VapC n=1 Tax=Hoeflea ulvae TaxID=2983764 RepID=A0ABT3YB85_9HYPH|nr:type II toxin-antitoxin system VapC family toxin [Hoeflea ulvae]MCY0093141.1 type II toxin-antitoxin system VapC family toxin [Hoeflea ulvae]